MRAVFGLTETEARLPQFLFEGADVAEVAQRLAMSVGALRTHLRAIFRKTGVSRQATLVDRLRNVM